MTSTDNYENNLIPCDTYSISSCFLHYSIFIHIQVYFILYSYCVVTPLAPEERHFVQLCKKQTNLKLENELKPQIRLNSYIARHM